MAMSMLHENLNDVSRRIMGVCFIASLDGTVTKNIRVLQSKSTNISMKNLQDSVNVRESDQIGSVIDLLRFSPNSFATFQTRSDLKFDKPSYASYGFLL